MPKRPTIIKGLILIGLWFIPDILSVAPIFPMHSVATAGGTDLIALLTPPAVGALFILISVTLRDGAHTVSTAILASIGALIVTLPENNHLPIAGPWATAATLAAMAAAAVANRYFGKPRIARIILVVPPAAALLVVLAMCILGGHSFAYLISFKTPVVLYLLMETAIVAEQT